MPWAVILCPFWMLFPIGWMFYLTGLITDLPFVATMMGASAMTASPILTLALFLSYKRLPNV
jgi:hypothetical protein